MPTNSPERLGQKQKLSGGAVIATAVASVVVGVAILAAVVIGLCCWRRKREKSFEHGTSQGFPRRNPSVLSKAGLLGGQASVTGIDSSYEIVSPISERRNSKPLVFDQRLNPNAFMQHDDGSRTSVLTMQDNQDYTRTLNVSLKNHDSWD
jgi:cell wall integrity and stress response component